MSVLRGGAGWRAHPALRLLSQPLLVLNPPHHTRSHRVVAAWFTPDRVAVMASSIRRVVDDLLDALLREHPVDLIEGFADRLPLGVVQPVLRGERWPFGDFRKQTKEFNLLLERAPPGAHQARRSGCDRDRTVPASARGPAPQVRPGGPDLVPAERRRIR
ncbi:MULTISPECIES: hypothetical protein [Actinosynnema]|uniref:hypothetical protein n=1 Tax=Actinosynnema TaxID=40566 RepID=UPI0031D69582